MANGNQAAPNSHSLNDFHRGLARIGLAVTTVVPMAVDHAAKLIEEEAKRVLGSYDYGWEQLAPSTQAERQRLGFTPNDPLLRTGDLKNSIEKTEAQREGPMAVVAYVGSNSPYAAAQELGTATIPARSYLGGATMHEEHAIREETGRRIHAAQVAALFARTIIP